MFRIFPQYKVILCPSCGLAQFVKELQKTRRCPNSKCRKGIDLEHVLVLARTYEIREAVEIVQRAKANQHELRSLGDIKPILEEDSD